MEYSISVSKHVRKSLLYQLFIFQFSKWVPMCVPFTLLTLNSGPLPEFLGVRIDDKKFIYTNVLESLLSVNFIKSCWVVNVYSLHPKSLTQSQ